MPKHIIEFQIPEENEELHTALNAGNVASKIWDWEQLMRSIIKYGQLPYELEKVVAKGKLTSDDVQEVVDAMRDEYFKIMNEE